MEINAKYITLLTREGEFLKAKNQKQDYVLGEEISFFPSHEFSSNKSRIFRINKFRFMVASSLAIMLIFLSFFPYYLNNRVYAYMSIDVNPSIELGVNRSLQVVSMEAYNVEGKEIVNDIEKWEKESIEDVTNSIIHEFEKEGYLKQGKSVLITTTVMNDDNVEEEKKLEKKIEQISTSYQKKDIIIEAVSTNKEQRKEANTKGISTGQLLKIENQLPDKKKENINKSELKKKENKSDKEWENNHSQKRKQKENNGRIQEKKQYSKNDNQISKHYPKHQKKNREALKEKKHENRYKNKYENRHQNKYKKEKHEKNGNNNYH